MRTVDKPEEMLAEAIRCERIARESSTAGDFRTAAYFNRESAWFLKYAADLEAGKTC